MKRAITAVILLGVCACSEPPPIYNTDTFWTYERTTDFVRGGNAVTAMTEGKLNGDEAASIADPGTLRLTIKRVAGQQDTGTLETSCHPGGDILLRVDQSSPVSVPCVVSDTSMGVLSSGTPTFGADVVSAIAGSDNVYVELRGGPRAVQYVFFTGGLDLTGG